MIDDTAYKGTSQAETGLGRGDRSFDKGFIQFACIEKGRVLFFFMHTHGAERNCSFQVRFIQFISKKKVEFICSVRKWKSSFVFYTQKINFICIVD